MSDEVLRLPLWKNALEQMRAEGIHYGKTYPAEFFEGHLKAPRDSMKFSLAIADIRRSLEHDGFFLSGRGQKGNQYVILPPASNAAVMRTYSAKAMDALKRGVILGTNTRIDTLSDSERRKHENTLEKIATRAALMARAGSVAKIVRTHAPKLLSEADQAA